jgi:hypothetical protein
MQLSYMTFLLSNDICGMNSFLVLVLTITFVIRSYDSLSVLSLIIKGKSSLTNSTVISIRPLSRGIVEVNDAVCWANER